MPIKHFKDCRRTGDLESFSDHDHVGVDMENNPQEMSTGQES